MALYDDYNREERAICAHLFRLLHEDLDSQNQSALLVFLNSIKKVKTLKNIAEIKYDNIGIYNEVAIIRDAFENRKPEVYGYMDELTRIIMAQEGITECTLYSNLQSVLSDIKKTHPEQIRRKAKREGIKLSGSEDKVYDAMQAMFNAKPDLAITIDDLLIVFEAKFTYDFDTVQYKRTENIVQVWSELLFKDFGFDKSPKSLLLKIGAKRYNPDISWTQILNIAEQIYKEGDRTLISLRKGVELLKKYQLE